MMPPTSIDGTDITGATIDGTDIEEITVDGDVVFSAGPTIVDNFESGNLNAYRNTSNMAISTSTVAEGTFSLEYQNPSGVIDMVSVPGDGLNAYPEKGQKFSWLIMDGSTRAAPTVCFGVGLPGPDSYMVKHDPNGGDYQFRRIDNGSANAGSRISVSMNTNEFYEYEIQWHDGSGSEPDNTIEITIFEIDSSLNRINNISNQTFVDSTYPNNKGIGYGDQTGFGAAGQAFVDNYKIIDVVD